VLLRFIIVMAKGGRRVAGVFQEGVTLSNYYDPDAVIARYAEVGVTMDPIIFTTEMRGLVRAVITDNLSEELRLPITGLCLGYPIEETLKCMGKLER